MDYLHRLAECTPDEEILLLPSPYATVLSVEGVTRLAGPHDAVRRVRGVDALMFCPPHVLKAFAGHPGLFVESLVSAEDVPLLRAFDEHRSSRWPELLDDLRRAVDVTGDERQFAEVWRSLVSGTDSGARRQAERLCRRYAGQTPTAVRRRLRLSAQLAADIRAGRHRPLGGFADQSHYIRECRALTGQTPGRWCRTSAVCHTADSVIRPLRTSST